MFRNLRQKLVRIPFPSRPRKKVGSHYKIMSTFITNYDDGFDSKLTRQRKILSKEISAGFLLFISTTYGNYNPIEKNGKIKVKIKMCISDGKSLVDSKYIQTIRDKAFIEEFCPTLVSHVENENTWNQEI